MRACVSDSEITTMTALAANPTTFGLAGEVFIYQNDEISMVRAFSLQNCHMVNHHNHAPFI